MADPTDPVEDLYAALGLGHDASAKDIAGAHRRLGGEADGGRAADLAYEILGDAGRRRAHDATTRARQRASSNDAVGSASPTAGRRSAPDLELRLSFEQAALGTTATVHLVGRVPCAACEGAGAAPDAPSTCEPCGGSGRVARRSSAGISIRHECAACGGTGVPPPVPCLPCGGTGRVEEGRDVSVRVPPGVEEGARIRFRAPGSAAEDDVHATVRIEPHPYFERRGADILLRLPITLAEAALGVVVTVPTLTGAVAIRVPAGTPHGRTFRLAGRGIAAGSGHGDLLATIEVVVPREVSEEQRAALEAFAAATSSPRAHFEEAMGAA